MEDNSNKTSNIYTTKITDKDDNFLFKAPEAKVIKLENIADKNTTKVSDSSKEITKDEAALKIDDRLKAAEKRLKMQKLVQSFSDEQLSRYEMYRRSSFPKAPFKRLMHDISGCAISQNVVIAMSGIAKIFVGELMEEAADVMDQLGETTPVQPKHIREAHRRLKYKDSFPYNKNNTPTLDK